MSRIVRPFSSLREYSKNSVARALPSMIRPFRSVINDASYML